MNACIRPRLLGPALAVGLTLLLAPAPCRADLLPVTFPLPTITGSGNSLSYNATTGEFTDTVTSSAAFAYAYALRCDGHVSQLAVDVKPGSYVNIPVS